MCVRGDYVRDQGERRDGNGVGKKEEGGEERGRHEVRVSGF